MGLKNTEIEFKYNADKISREDFDKLAKKIGKIKSSFSLRVDTNADYGFGLPADHYFTKGDRFMRFRYDGHKWELTSKVKTVSQNNKVRTEYNLPLGDDMDYEKAKGFAEVFDLEPDFSIQKDVQVYWYKNIVISHYTCYDLTGKKLNTFMEIECDEHFPWESREVAEAELVDWEKKLTPLGISPQKRIKKSLFEIYTKVGNNG